MSETFQGTVPHTSEDRQTSMYVSKSRWIDIRSNLSPPQYFDIFVETHAYLRCWTLELQEHHGTGTLHDVKVEQEWLVPTIHTQH